MICKKILNNKMFGLVLLTAPILADATTYTWDSTSSTDLNSAGNWTPGGGPPGSGDDAEFNSTIPGIVLSSEALSGAGFSVSTIDFTNVADVFSLTINNGILTFSGGGIGAAISGSLTNATVTASNIDNSAALTDQILFSGNPSTSSSAALIATNSGTTTNSTASSAQISALSPFPADQIYSPNFFSVQDGASFTVTNTGTNHFNASSLQVGYVSNTQLQFDNVFNGSNVDDITLTISNTGTNSGTGNTNSIGYVGNPQHNVMGNFFSGNNLNATVTNTGYEDSTGSGSNNVGYIGDNQIEWDGACTVQNSAIITMSNTGTITDNVSGNNNQVGLISGNQLYVGAALFAGNSLTLSATNTGTNNGSGSGSAGPSNVNATGVIQGYQLFIGGAFTAGTSPAITASNSGINTGSGSYNQTGLVQGPQFSTGAAFKTGASGSITISNTGTNSGSGGNNLIGEVQGQQAFFGGNVTYGDNTVISITNEGVDGGSGASNQLGYVAGQQLDVGGTFTAGNTTSITVSNAGTSSNSGTGGHAIGVLTGDQVTYNQLCTVGDNATITISNEGIFSGAGGSNQIGYLGSSNQITTAGNFLSGNTLKLTVSNTGVDDGSGTTNSVGLVSYQCSHDAAFTTGDNAIITVSNTGAMGGSATGHTVGSNSSGQFTVGGAFLAGNSLMLSATNTGTDTTTGDVNNNVATNFGQQILVDGTFIVGDNATITATNKGTNSNSTSVGNVGYLSGQNQMAYQGAFSAGKNLTLTAINSAEGVSNGGNIGSCQIQIDLEGISTFEDGSVISAFNEGFGSVEAQIQFDGGFTVTSGKITIQASNSLEGTVLRRSIYVGGSLPGGNANIILTNAFMDISSSAISFTIGELNGDSTSSVQSIPILTINTDEGVFATFAGAIENFPSMTASLVKTGPGSQTLSGVSTYTGGTTVDGGSLIINGSVVGGMVVSSLGTVKGTGTVGGTLTIDGTIAPGNSIGTLHTTTYVQNIGSIYDAEVNGAGQSDLIDATGSATINGGTVVVSSPDGTYKFQNRYTIVSAASRTGTYVGATAVSSTIVPTLTYDAEHVYLTLTTDIASAANTFNELAVAKQLDAIVDPTPLQNVLLSEIASLSAPQAESALDSVSGWQYTNVALIANGISAQFITRLYDPIRNIVTSDQKCCVCAPCTDTALCCNDFTVWTEAGGTVARVNGNGNAHTFNLKGWEATAGIQKTFLCNWTMGLAGSFEHDFIDYKHHGGTERSDTWLIGLYSLYRPSYFYTFVDFAYGYSFNEMNRAVHIGSLSYKGKGKPDVSQFTFYGELGVDWKANPVLIQPFIGVEAGSYWRQGVTESNLRGWALHIDRKSDSLASTRVGTHFTVGSLSGKVGSASLDLSWNKRWTGKTTTISEEFVNFGNDFIIKGVHLGSNSFYYALTFSRCINKHWKIHAKGEGNVWNHAYQFDGLAGVEYSW